MQNKTQHTPGPWTNTPMQDTIWANDGDIKIATIADLPWVENPVTGRLQSQADVEEANACLIAAAPELLEACKVALANLAPLYSSEHLVIKSLKNAITKVKGKE